MAEKPRVKAPKQRGTASQGSGVDRRVLAIGVAVVGLLLGLGAVIALVGVGGGGGESVAAKVEKAQTQLAAAGCALHSYKGVSREHINDATARPKSWNSFPPTSGPHYVTPAIYGYYTQPVELARMLHGLEHGAAYMLYGSKTPANTADLLQKIYNRDPRGLYVAPLPELGDKIALGAWTSEGGDNGTGHLAKCAAVNVKAFEAFIAAYRGRGPEGFSLDQLQPGGS